MKKAKPVFLGSKIKQPNRVSQAIFHNCTLTMHKIFNALSLVLHKYVDLSYTKTDIAQMDLFQGDSKIITVELPYNTIVDDPTHYKEVDASLVELCKKVIEIPFSDESGAGWKRITNLFTATIPVRRNNNIFLEIEKSTAQLLIYVDPKKGYTSFFFDIPYYASSRHTPTMYKALASWRHKGKMIISRQDLNRLLSLKEGSYNRYYDLKRKVFKPVQKDLQKNSEDFWFDCDRKDFYYIKNNVEMFCFTLIDKESIQEDQNKTSYITHILRNAGLNENQINSIYPIISDDNISKDKILTEITRIDTHIYEIQTKSSKNKINDRASYMTKSLINFGKAHS